MTVRAYHWCLLLLVSNTAACRSPAARGSVDAAMAGTSWTEPRQLADAAGRPRSIWAPSLASWHDSLVVVGNAVTPGGMVGPGSMAGHGLVIAHRPRMLDSLFGLYPQVAVSPRTGDAHLLWAEPAGSDSLTWLTTASSLWWSSISVSGHWSHPARLLTGYQVHWAPTMSSPPVFDADGTLHAAVALWSPATGHHVLHLAMDSSRWEITPVHTAIATYTALGIADNGDLAVAWVAQAREPRGPPNAAHIAFSTDRGHTWSAPVRLDTASREASGQLRIIGMKDSFLALWGRYGSATFPLASIGRALVRAGSRDVTLLSPIEPGYPIYGPGTARDSCGRAHLVVRHVAGAHTHADYTQLTGGADTLQHVDTTTPATEAGIGVAGDALILAWVSRTASGEFESQVRTRPVLCGR